MTSMKENEIYSIDSLNQDDELRIKVQYFQALSDAEKRKEELDRKYLDIKNTIKGNSQKIIQAIENRQEALLNQLEYLYSKNATVFASEQSTVQEIIEEWKDTPLESRSSPSSSPKSVSKNKSVDNFVKDGLVVKEDPKNARRLSSMKMLEDWTASAGVSYIIDESRLDQLVSEISQLGQVV
mmetsp:Transcript_1369/g.1451  ORF Transcript_1369/g.1451 Transcript_1369/m.1451 type:complete len:182 (+) Transcript_1369:137-682(+)